MRITSSCMVRLKTLSFGPGISVVFMINRCFYTLGTLDQLVISVGHRGIVLQRRDVALPSVMVKRYCGSL